MTYRLLQGDCMDTLKTLESESVQTCVTSPPYFGLRSYLDDEDEHKSLEVGLEPTPDEFVQKLVEVFREVRRVLRSSGTCWLNLGDSFGAGKQLLMIPARVALALQSDGWILRSDIIWSKKNCMPESVTDRPTKSHEYIFLLSKSERYFYDHKAILEPNAASTQAYFEKYKAQPVSGTQRKKDLGKFGQTRIGANSRAEVLSTLNPDGRNKRTVWTVATKSYSDAHFATFPPDLIRPCILAGSAVGDTVLDPFSGAATTGLVALQHGRQYIGCELNPEYIELSEKRLRPLAAQPRLLELA